MPAKSQEKRRLATMNAEYNSEEGKERQEEEDEEGFTNKQQEDAQSSPPSTKIDSSDSESSSLQIESADIIVPLDSLLIGTWQRKSMPGAELVAIIWYHCKKLAWQIQEGPELMKIEIPWGYISAINRLDFHLVLQLNTPPIFFLCQNLVPGRPVWRTTSDFTQGQQAARARVHSVLIDFLNKDKEVVESYYEKMLACDARLRQLSQMPFPSMESLYFDLIPPASALSNADSSDASNIKPIEALTMPDPIFTGDQSQTPTSQGLNVDTNKAAGSSELLHNMDFGLNSSLGGNVGYVNEGSPIEGFSTNKQPEEAQSSYSGHRDTRPWPSSISFESSKVIAPLDSIVIGTWQRNSSPQVGLVARIMFLSKKLEWQIYEGQLSKKIVIRWSSISAIKATYQTDQSLLLQLQLDSQPRFYYGETKLCANGRRRHLWRITSDFTEGKQATQVRIHNVYVSPGANIRSCYEMIIQCDARLRQLSQKPFPNFDLIPPAGRQSQTPTLQGLNVDANNVDLSLSSSLGGNVGLNVDEGSPNEGEG